MRTLVTKTTQPLHTPKSSLFISNYRYFARRRVYYGTRGRWRSNVARNISVKKFFMWLYTERLYQRSNMLKRLLSAKVRTRPALHPLDIDISESVEVYLHILIFRSQFVPTLVDARLLVRRGQAYVNGVRVFSTLFVVLPGDIVEVIQNKRTYTISNFRWYVPWRLWIAGAYTTYKAFAVVHPLTVHLLGHRPGGPPIKTALYKRRTERLAPYLEEYLDSVQGAIARLTSPIPFVPLVHYLDESDEDWKPAPEKEYIE